MKETLEQKVIRLEKELEAYKAETTYVQSYLSVKKVIDDINASIKGVDLVWAVKIGKAKDGEEDTSDEDAVKIERVVKIVENIGNLNDILEKLEKKISPEKLSEIKESGSTLEKALRGE